MSLARAGGFYLLPPLSAVSPCWLTSLSLLEIGGKGRAGMALVGEARTVVTIRRALVQPSLGSAAGWLSRFSPPGAVASMLAGGGPLSRTLSVLRCGLHTSSPPLLSIQFPHLVNARAPLQLLGVCLPSSASLRPTSDPSASFLPAVGAPFTTHLKAPLWPQAAAYSKP